MLNVRYDDGFVAYLNGQEVQRALFTGTPVWNSANASNHDDAAAVQFEAFDISAYISQLRPGANILAIQGINAGTTSSDFLISVELTASQGATTATTPGGVSSDRRCGTRGRSRSVPVPTSRPGVLSGTTWSALNEVIFAVGPVAESLRISETHVPPGEHGRS